MSKNLPLHLTSEQRGRVRLVVEREVSSLRRSVHEALGIYADAERVDAELGLRLYRAAVTLLGPVPGCRCHEPEPLDAPLDAPALVEQPLALVVRDGQGVDVVEVAPLAEETGAGARRRRARGKR